MRICFVTTSFPRHNADGYAQFVHQQARSLLDADEENRVIVVAPHAPGLALRETIDGVDVVRFRYFFPSTIQCLAYQHEGLFATVKRSRLALIQLPFFMLAMMITLLRHSGRAQLIHAQWLPTCIAALPVAFVRRIPLFATARGADVNTGASALSRTVLWIASRAKIVFVVSDDFKRKLSHAGGGLRLETLYNGVHHPELCGLSDRKRIESGTDNSSRRPVLLFVGGLIARKRIDTLIEAMRLIKRRGLIDMPTVRIVGQGPLKESLANQIQASHLSDCMQFAGTLDRSRLLEEMLHSDLLVLPSESEGRPNVVLEAFSCGLAVLASDIPGTSELVEQGMTGELFEPGNAAQLAEKIEKLVDDRQYRLKLASKGHDSLSEKGLTWSAHGQRLLTFYSTYVNG